MIGESYRLLRALVAFTRLAEWFVFSVLFAPFDDCVAAMAEAVVGYGCYASCESTVGVVLEGGAVLMGGSLAAG